MTEQIEVAVSITRTRTILESYTVSFPVQKDAEEDDIYVRAHELAEADPTGWVDPFGGRVLMEDLDTVEYSYEIINEEVLEPKEEERSEQNILL
tara:strand:+ start:2838 stop:3119 length:282 start_codon:yes stop_codon:yes gene_type:complete